MDAYPLLNRCAVVVKPKPPFWDWVNKTNELNDPFVFEGDADGNIYLVPDYESEPDINQAIRKYIGQHYEAIFISELEAWYTDPEAFPEISYELFEEWFSFSSHTMIFDTVNKPLKKE